MYQYQVQRKNNIASLLLLIFALVAVALLCISVILQAWVGLLQLGAVICLALEVAVFSRYFRRSYVYRIAETSQGNAPDFTVSELNGRDSVTVCRLSLASLLSVDKKPKRIARGKEKLYNYCVDIAPQNAYLLRFEEGGEKYSILLSPDEKMLSILQYHLEQNQNAEK